MPDSLDDWIEQQYTLSVQGLLRSISPQLTKRRPGFGQTIVAQRGSVIASPVLAAYDPDPDYYFHWFRDSALVMDALRLVQQDAAVAGDAATLFAEFVQFSLALKRLDGAELTASHKWQAQVSDEYRKYLRTEADLGSVRADRVDADTRVNPDGSLDISSWARPQNDGPALRALTVLRWLAELSPDASCRAAAATLLRGDLDYVLKFSDQPCFDIWEEEIGFHYYTLLVSAAALRDGAKWLEFEAAEEMAAACRQRCDELLRKLHGYWLGTAQHYSSRKLQSGVASAKQLDFAVILAVLHSRNAAGPHSVADPKVQSTFERLEALFQTEYPLNKDRGAHLGTAMGRYGGDHYYSGGPYFFSTLGAAEWCYRAVARDATSAAAMFRGDQFLRMVRAHAPADGKLAEQFDRSSGAPRSARDLAWSHAAFISARAARRALPRSG